MGTAAPCPQCGAAPGGDRGAAGERPPSPLRNAVDALYDEVTRIRAFAEASANESEEMRMLRETVARLRGSSVLAAHYGGPRNGQPRTAQPRTAQPRNGQSGQHATLAAHRSASTGATRSPSRSSSAA